MEYRLLGRTGVSVSSLCLGTMMFGPWGNDDRADSIAVIRAALDAGINFVDTADVYSNGVSEEIVGEALRGRRDDVTLSTGVPDRIDQLVTPGVTINPEDNSYGAAELLPTARRR